MTTEEDSFEKHLRANSAIKDILYMYWTIVNYSGLYDDFGYENGLFEPLEFITYEKDDEASIGPTELKLLHEGSAIKLICAVMQAWGQWGHSNENKHPIASEIEYLLVNKKLEHIPELRDALAVSIVSLSDIEALAPAIYEKYVLGYFHFLSQGQIPIQS